MKTYMRSYESKYSPFCIFTCAVILITNLTQLPALVNFGITSQISMFVWFLFFVVCFYKDSVVWFGNTKPFLAITILFLIYFLIAGFINRAYFASQLPRSIFLTVFVFIVGLMAGRHLSEEEIKQGITCYIIGGIIVCVSVFMTYIFGRSLSGRAYLYVSKNSVSQILLTCWILIITLKFSDRKKMGLVGLVAYSAGFLLLTYTMIALKSRATIIGMPIALMWFLMHGEANKKVRNFTVLILGIVTVLLIVNQDIFDLLVNEVLLGGRDRANLNDLSSGRMDEWMSFWNDIAGDWMFGHGRDKRESLILTALLEFGILGGSFILIIAIWPFIWGIRNISTSNHMYMLFTSIALIYFINGVFEQLAPFGPGVKCYFLWFMFGMLKTMQRGRNYERL